MAETSSLDIELTPELTAAGRARKALAPLREHMPREAHEDLRLVVSELVTNSVLHGPGSPIRLRLVVEDNGNIRGDVEDDGDGSIPGRAGEPLRDGGSDGGYGLRIVDSLTQRWGVYEGSTHIWFEFSA